MNYNQANKIINTDREAFKSFLYNKLESLYNEIEEIEAMLDSEDEFTLFLRQLILKPELNTLKREYETVTFWYKISKGGQVNEEWLIQKENVKNLDIRRVCELIGVEHRQGFINCPHHNESTPSCKLYKNSYYCFGCGKSGDNASLAMAYTGQDFKSVINLLS